MRTSIVVDSVNESWNGILSWALRGGREAMRTIIDYGELPTEWVSLAWELSRVMSIGDGETPKKFWPGKKDGRGEGQMFRRCVVLLWGRWMCRDRDGCSMYWGLEKWYFHVCFHFHTLLKEMKLWVSHDRFEAWHWSADGSLHVGLRPYKCDATDHIAIARSAFSWSGVWNCSYLIINYKRWLQLSQLAKPEASARPLHPAQETCPS